MFIWMVMWCKTVDEKGVYKEWRTMQMLGMMYLLVASGFWVLYRGWLLQAGGGCTGQAGRSLDSMPLTQTSWHHGWVASPIWVSLCTQVNEEWAAWFSNGVAQCPGLLRVPWSEALGPTPFSSIVNLPGSALYAGFLSEDSYVKRALLRTNPG